MKVTVVLENEEHRVEVDARDRRAFERLARADIGPSFPKGSLRDVVQTIPETYLAWLAYHATKRAGYLGEITWVEFERQLLEVQAETEEGDGLDPTQQTPTVT